MRLSMRCAVLVNRRRSPTKDEADRFAREYCVERCIVRKDFAVDLALADAACDKLRVLSAEVENQDQLLGGAFQDREFSHNLPPLPYALRTLKGLTLSGQLRRYRELRRRQRQIR